MVTMRTKKRLVFKCYSVAVPFVKVKGIRNKRVVVSIDGLASVALSEISDGMIEPLDDQI